MIVIPDDAEPSEAPKKTGIFKVVARVAWALLVLSIAAWYIYTHRDGLAEGFGSLSLPAVALSAILLFVAKLAVARMIQITVWRSRVRAAFWQTYMIIAATQVAKYLPGSIWHFFGRAALYRRIGMTPGGISKAFLTEQAWLVLGAGCAGLIFLVAYALKSGDTSWVEPLLNVWRQFESSSVNYLVVAIVGVVGLVALIAVWLRWRNAFEKIVRATIPSPQGAFWAAMIQVGLGVSFYALIRDIDDNAPFLYVVAVSSIATGLGYLAVFAPAGLGVKDVALIGFLSPFVPHEYAFIAVSVHRVIYVAMDFATGLTAVQIKHKEEDTPENQRDSGSR